MGREYKSGEGLCMIDLYEYGEPLVIWRINKDGNPILNEKEVLIIKPGRMYYSEACMGLGFHGKAYQFTRYSLLKEKNYDPKKCNLSKEEVIELKNIVDKKLEGKLKNFWEKIKVRFIRGRRRWDIYRFR